MRALIDELHSLRIGGYAIEYAFIASFVGWP